MYLNSNSSLRHSSRMFWQIWDRSKEKFSKWSRSLRNYLHFIEQKWKSSQLPSATYWKEQNSSQTSPRSSAPATDSQPGPEEIQGPALWSARVCCSAHRSPPVHRKKDGPSKAPWIRRKRRKNNTDMAQIFRFTIIASIELIIIILFNGWKRLLRRTWTSLRTELLWHNHIPGSALVSLHRSGVLETDLKTQVHTGKTGSNTRIGSFEEMGQTAEAVWQRSYIGFCWIEIVFAQVPSGKALLIFRTAIKLLTSLLILWATPGY